VATLVLTLIGDDRAGLVRAVADTVDAHGGNWERSEMTELAGKFAGIVEVTVPDRSADALAAALGELHGALDITVVPAASMSVAASAGARAELRVLGTDRAGIVRQITHVLATHDVNIVLMRTEVRDAPMAGGRLFEARATVELPASADAVSVAEALEALTHELLVDIDLETVDE
jgi:glycine cleavage system regulatory protein